MKGIYLDNSMTTRPSPRTISGMLPFYSDYWGNPMSPHMGGHELSGPIEQAYKAIYRLLGAKESDTVIFTSSGAEAVNHVFQIAHHEITRRHGKHHYIVSANDDAPALMCVSRLEELGCIGTMLEPNRQGIIPINAIREAITPQTALLSLSWGNGMLGSIQPVQEIAELCREKGVMLHLEASHILGKLYFDYDAIGAQYMTFGGDLFHAPKGTGGVFIRQGAPRASLIVGGLEQGGLRAGTLNVPGLIALGEAAREADDQRDYLCTEIARLRNKFEDELLAACPQAQLLFKNQERLPHISVAAFPGIVNETFLYLLNRKKVYASIGGGSFQQLTLLVQACGIPQHIAQCALSFSLSRDTSDDDVDTAVEIITAAYQQYNKCMMVL